MNKTLLTAGLLLLIKICSYGQTELYYWSGKKKIKLAIDSSKLILLPRDGDFNSARLKGVQEVKNYKTLHSNYLLVEAEKGTVLSSKLIREEISIRNLTYAFTTSNGKGMIPTGEILLSPKKGVPISTILAKVNAPLTIQNITKYGDYKLRVEDNSNVLVLSNAFYESGLVEFAHPNFVAEITLFQNDPLYPDQYYLNNTGQFGGAAGIDINAPEAWALSIGLNNVRVAVIDDGVENHEDINGRIIAGFTPMDANGFGTPTFAGSHGQQCAGIIAATNNNSTGIAGVAQCAQIIPVNIFFGNEDIPELAEAIDWAWDEGQADVLSNSWGFSNGDSEFDAIQQAITRARTQGRGQLGSIVVFASGNNQQNYNGVMFPARADGVVTVGAIDRSGSIWNYSSRGSQMDLVAPSGDVNNTGDVRTTDRMDNNGLVNGNYINTFGGTSAACPQVSGTAALMLSVNPNLTETQVVDMLRNSATDMGSSGHDNTFGYGRLNTFAAVLSAMPTIINPIFVCTSQTFAVQNLAAGATVVWASNNTFGLSIHPSTGVATRENNFNGNVTVTAVITGGCGTASLSRTVWVGTPSLYGMTINGTMAFPSTVCAGNGNSFQALLSPSYPAGQWYQFDWSGTNATVTSSGGDAWVVYSYAAGNYATVSATVSGQCGQWFGNSTWAVEIINCGGGGVDLVWPNPSSEEITITSEAFEMKSAANSEVIIVSEQNEVMYHESLKQRTERKVLVSNWKAGTYYATFINGDKKKQVRLLIQH